MDEGVWRTVGGRRIFIKNGQDLASAMKESGKFKLRKNLKEDRLNELKKELNTAKGFLVRAKIENEIVALENGFNSYEEYKKSKLEKRLKNAFLEDNKGKKYKIDEKELNDFIRSEKIDIEKYNNDFHIDGYRKENYDLQEKYAKNLNYDNKIKVISKEAYQKYDGLELARVVSGNSKEDVMEIVKNTVYGEIRYSNKKTSYFGKGIYFASKNLEKKLIEEYGKKNNKVINAKISKNANILEFKNMNEYIKGIKKLSNGIGNENFARMIYNHIEVSNMLFMNSGVDIIKIIDNNYYVVLNRGVLITYDK